MKHGVTMSRSLMFEFAQQKNPSLSRKPWKSQIGGSGDRSEPYRWSAIRVGLVSAGTEQQNTTWADLEGPQINHLSLDFFGGRSLSTKCPRMRVKNWSAGLICAASCTIFRAGAVPGAPGARRGPQGAENRPKARGQIYFMLRNNASGP